MTRRLWLSGRARQLWSTSRKRFRGFPSGVEQPARSLASQGNETNKVVVFPKTLDSACLKACFAQGAFNSSFCPWLHERPKRTLLLKYLSFSEVLPLEVIMEGGDHILQLRAWAERLFSQDKASSRSQAVMNSCQDRLSLSFRNELQ